MRILSGGIGGTAERRATLISIIDRRRQPRVPGLECGPALSAEARQIGRSIRQAGHPGFEPGLEAVTLAAGAMVLLKDGVVAPVVALNRRRVGAARLVDDRRDA